VALAHPPNDDQISSRNMLYLELLHNYTTSTIFTLNSDETIRAIWRIQVPKIAFSNDFVMNAMLALSALHMAHFSTEKKDYYIDQAARLHQSGLRTAAALVPSVTVDNAPALWIFTAITSIVSLASPRKPEDILLIGNGTIAEWLKLLRSIQSMIQMYYEILCDGSLGAMFRAGRQRTSLRDAHKNDKTIEAKQLAKLLVLVEQATVNQVHLAVYTQAIDELRGSFNVAYAPGFRTYESADVFIWVFRLDDKYLQLLVDQTQEALAIFAYFCVILKRFEGTWYVNGWSNHLLQKIYSLLDEEHRLWIRWPIEETGSVLY
jgi:hypothetical protein